MKDGLDSATETSEAADTNNAALTTTPEQGKKTPKPEGTLVAKADPSDTANIIILNRAAIFCLARDARTITLIAEGDRRITGKVIRKGHSGSFLKEPGGAMVSLKEDDQVIIHHEPKGEIPELEPVTGRLAPKRSIKVESAKPAEAPEEKAKKPVGQKVKKKAPKKKAAKDPDAEEAARLARIAAYLKKKAKEDDEKVPTITRDKAPSRTELSTTFGLRSAESVASAPLRRRPDRDPSGPRRLRETPGQKRLRLKREAERERAEVRRLDREDKKAKRAAKKAKEAAEAAQKEAWMKGVAQRGLMVAKAMGQHWKKEQKRLEQERKQQEREEQKAKRDAATQKRTARRQREERRLKALEAVPALVGKIRAEREAIRAYLKAIRRMRGADRQKHIASFTRGTEQDIQETLKALRKNDAEAEEFIRQIWSASLDRDETLDTERLLNTEQTEGIDTSTVEAKIAAHLAHFAELREIEANPKAIIREVNKAIEACRIPPGTLRRGANKVELSDLPNAKNEYVAVRDLLKIRSVKVVKKPTESLTALHEIAKQDIDKINFKGRGGKYKNGQLLLEALIGMTHPIPLEQLDLLPFSGEGAQKQKPSAEEVIKKTNDRLKGRKSKVRIRVRGGVAILHRPTYHKTHIVDKLIEATDKHPIAQRLKGEARQIARERILAKFETQDPPQS